MRERSPWVRRLDSAWLDVVIVVILLGFVTLSAGYAETYVIAIDVATILPLLMRRRLPTLSFTLLSLMMATHLFVEQGPMASDIAFLFALYAIAAYGPMWAVWGGVGVALLGATLSVLRWSDGSATWTTAAISMFMTASLALMAWLLGYLARTRRAYVAALEQRAEQLERDASQQAAIAAAAERARIAREMHDVVAHSLSVMVVQADGALYASAKDPAVAPEALRTISQTGRASMSEMRKLLGLLRGDEQPDQMAPLPRADDIADLVESVRASGLPVALTMTGPIEAVDPATGLTAFRIVQEALTNTLKHGGPQVRATVQVAVASDHVAVVIEDDGRGVSSAADGRGHGIVGIRERIAIHEGHIDAGPRPGGGFRVSATIPWGDDA